MSRAYGARSSMAGAFETSYGTVPATGFVTLPFNSSALSGAKPLLADDVLGQGRDPLPPQPDTETVGGDVQVPIDLEAIGVWLKASFGAPVTTDGGDGTWTHVFASGAWELPSLAIETGTPEVPAYAMASGVRVDRFAFGQSFNGWAAATLSLMAQAETIAAASAAGAPTSLGYTRFRQEHGVLTLGGAALADVTAAQFTYANNLDRVETIGNGGRIGGLDPTMATLSGQMTLRFATRALLDQAVAGDPAAASFGYARAAGHLTFALPRLYLPKPTRSITGPRGIEATFDWQAAQGAGGAPMLTATLVNTVEAY